MGGELGDVFDRPREQVVHADDLVPAHQEELAEVRADEAGAAGDKDPHREC